MSNAKHERIQQRLNKLEKQATDSEIVKKTIDVIKTYTGKRLDEIRKRVSSATDSSAYKYYHDRCDCLLQLLAHIDTARRVNHDTGLNSFLRDCAKKADNSAFPYLLRNSSTLYPVLRTLSIEVGRGAVPVREATNRLGQTIAELTEESEQLRRRNEVLTTENASLRRANSQLRGEVTDLKGQISNLDGKVVTLTQEKALSDQRVLTLEAQMARLMQLPDIISALSKSHAGPSSDTDVREQSGSMPEYNSQSACSPDSSYQDTATAVLAVGSGSSL